METSLTSDFAILSIVMGLMAGFGTLSAIRGVFTFLSLCGLHISKGKRAIARCFGPGFLCPKIPAPSLQIIIDDKN